MDVIAGRMDIHSESSTFWEALTFSTFLRQDDATPARDKYGWVEQCLDLLGLRPIDDKIILGSSVEQMKRLAIGVEMAARPSVLFLDEPTSRLDARSAKLIMDRVRKVAATGVTVVCAIHQPSGEVFNVFDSLLLLKRGSYTVYFGELGEDARKLVNYLESIDVAAPLPADYNPAMWILEAIGAGVGNTAGQTTDFADLFSRSANKAQLDANLDVEGILSPAPGTSPLAFQTKRAASNATQARLLVRRFFSMYWRTASYNLTRLGVQLSMGITFGVAYSNVDIQSYQGINVGVGVVFMTTLFSGFIAFSGVIPMIGEDRAAFYRERASQTYNALWYFVGMVLAEIPYATACGLLFTATLFPLVGFEGVPEFFFYWFNATINLLMTTYIGMFLAFALPSVEVAVGMGVLLMSIWGLTVGYNPPASAIPSGYKWLYHSTSQRYTLETLATIVFVNCDTSHPDRTTCKPLSNPPPTVREGLSGADFVDQVFNMNYDNVARDIGVVLGLMAAFGAFTLLCLRFVNHTKR